MVKFLPVTLAYLLGIFSSILVASAIGGAAIYAQTLGIAQIIHATEVHSDFPEADVYFPVIDPAVWREEKREDRIATDENNKHPFSFVEYRRIT